MPEGDVDKLPADTMAGTGEPARGAIGGESAPEKKHAHARGAVTFLMRQLKRAEDLADRDWGQIVQFAARVRDDKTASIRDRIRATELLTTLIAKGVDVAVILDKNERLDGGKSTENVAIIAAPTIKRVGDAP